MEHSEASSERRRREQAVKNAYALCRLDSAAPSEEVLALAKKYIEGKMELDEIADKLVNKYKRKYA